MSDDERNNCTREAYLNSVGNTVIEMQKDIYTTLKENFIGKRFKTRRIVNLANSCYTGHTPIFYTCFFLL